MANSMAKARQREIRSMSRRAPPTIDGDVLASSCVVDARA
jgi:hypothetical protein